MRAQTTMNLTIAALSVGERLELAQKLWESVRGDIEAAPLTTNQIVEIDRRIAEVDSGRVQCVPFDIMMTRLSRR